MPTKTSVYKKCMEDKKLAANVLLPLIEFEFAFLGSQKPAITQSKENFQQLKILFQICKAHNWVSTKIAKLGKKDEYWFKLSNKGFKEIYDLAGPMADKRKDQWAKLLCERAEATEKDRKISNKIVKLLEENEKGLTTTDLCLKLRRLPYTITRHLRKLKNNGIVTKSGNLWKLSVGAPANSPS